MSYKSLKIILIDLKKYIYENRYVFMFGAIIFILIYGSQLYSINARVDTENVINNSYYLNFIGNKRQGALFTRLIFEQLNFNPFFVSTVAMLIYILSMIAMTYLFNYLGDISAKISVIIFLIFLVHPIWMEQFYFNLQILEISVGLLLTICSVTISYYAIITNKISCKIIAVIMMIWSFSTYQSFTLLYIALSIICYILYYKKNINNDNNIKLILNLILLFIIAFVVNNIITNIFFKSIGYLESQIQWKLNPVKICISNIANHVIAVVTGKGLFYSLSYLISLILALICLFMYAYKHKNKKYINIYLLAGLGLQICPFLLTIYTAHEPVYRAQLVLPFVIACNIGIIIISSFKNRILTSTSYIIAIITLVSQTQIVMRLQYTDDIRFKQDIILSTQIAERINMTTNYIDKPVAFVGYKSAPLNGACERGELIGKSIFDINQFTEPHYYHSSNRISNLTKTMGFNFKNISESQMLEARKIAVDMPVWPAKESVFDNYDFIIVKLSEDQWDVDDDILEPSSIKLNIDNNMQFENNTTNAIDEVSVDVEDSVLKIRGWIIELNVVSEDIKTNIYILNSESNSMYKIITGKQMRNDVTVHFNDNTNYDQSGFIAKGDISLIDGNIEEYRIIIGYNKYNGEEKFVDTNRYINR